MDILAYRQVVVEDVQLEVKVDWPCQQDSLLAVLSPGDLLAFRETFLADRSEEADHDGADLVSLNPHRLALHGARCGPLKVYYLMLKDVSSRDVKSEWEFKGVIIVIGEAEAVVHEQESV